MRPMSWAGNVNWQLTELHRRSLWTSLPGLRCKRNPCRTADHLHKHWAAAVASTRLFTLKYCLLSSFHLHMGLCVHWGAWIHRKTLWGGVGRWGGVADSCTLGSFLGLVVEEDTPPHRWMPVRSMVVQMCLVTSPS